MSEEDPRYLSGYFLISEFDLLDPNFYRSVVLMIAHDEDGAFGLVVNRPSQATLGEVIEGVEDTPAASKCASPPNGCRGSRLYGPTTG